MSPALSACLLPPPLPPLPSLLRQIIEGTQLLEDHGGWPGDSPHSGARLVVRMVRGLLERDGERLKVLIDCLVSHILT